jgi:hypothetical protein
MGLFDTKTITSNRHYEHYYVDGSDMGPTQETEKAVYPYFLIQKIANAALGLLASLCLYQHTLFVAPLTVGSVFATLGFALGVFTVLDVFFDSPPAISFPSREIELSWP